MLKRTLLIGFFDFVLICHGHIVVGGQSQRPGQRKLPNNIQHGGIDHLRLTGLSATEAASGLLVSFDAQKAQFCARLGCVIGLHSFHRIERSLVFHHGVF